MTNPWKWKKIFSDEFKGFITIGQKTGTTLGSKATIEGANNTGSGENSHAEGQDVVASGKNSHAEGLGTIAAGANQHVFGKYNISDNSNIEIVGAGTDSARANIRTLDANGNESISGNFTPMANNSKDLGSSDKKWANIYATTIVSPTLSNPVINNATITGASIDATTTAPTAAPGTKTQQLATTEFVMQAFSHTDALQFKGIIDSSHDLPTNNYSAGWTYKVAAIGIYAGIVCEIGDMIIAINDGPATGDTIIAADWTVIQTNIDGAVVGPNSALNEDIAIFDGTTGKLIKDSGRKVDTTPTDDSINLITSGGVKTQLDLKAPLNSPTLTGEPQAPTPTASDNSTRIATTAYVQNVLDQSAALSGTPTAPSPAYSDDSTRIATTEFVHDVIETSPTLGGTPTAPTAADETNTTQIATTAFVMNHMSDTAATAVASASAAGTANYAARADHVHNIVVATGDSDGEVKIAGQNVAVKGLNTGAYADIADYIPKSVLTTPYSLIYAADVNSPSAIAPNTTLTKKFLSMTGDGVDGAVPVWEELPAHNFAPTGYGLGEAITTNLTELDLIQFSGWYKITQSSGLVIITPNEDPEEEPTITNEYPPIAEDGVIRADVFDAENMTITFYGSSILQRVKSNNIWGEWEWINPPMTANIEYRTTERYLGQPVYKKIFTATVAEDSTDEVIGTISNANTLFEYQILDATNKVLNPTEVQLVNSDFVANTSAGVGDTDYSILVKYI